MRLEMTHDLGINLLGTKANKHWWFNRKWGSTQPINGHLTNHNGILGKSWKQGMFMGYIIIISPIISYLDVSQTLGCPQKWGEINWWNSGMPTKWGKINWDDASSFFFFGSFSSQTMTSPPFADGRWSRIQRTHARRQRGQSPPKYISKYI